MNETGEYVNTVPAIVPRERTLIIAVKSVKTQALKPIVVVGIRNAKRKREAWCHLVARR